MSIKGYSTFPKALALLELHDQIQFSVLSRALIGGSHKKPKRKYSRRILQPSPNQLCNMFYCLSKFTRMTMRYNNEPLESCMKECSNEVKKTLANCGIEVDEWRLSSRHGTRGKRKSIPGQAHTCVPTLCRCQNEFDFAAVFFDMLLWPHHLLVSSWCNGLKRWTAES